jgi:hypothetical protein
MRAASNASSIALRATLRVPLGQAGPAPKRFRQTRPLSDWESGAAASVVEKDVLSRSALVIPVVHQTACTIVVGLFVASSPDFLQKSAA